MTQLTTEQFIKIVLGVFVFVVVVVGVFLFFRFKVIDFFKGYTDEEPQTGEQTGTGTQGGTPVKSYKINSVDFRVGSNGVIEFLVNSESNCERTEYQVWEENSVRVENWFQSDWIGVIGDIKKSERINLQKVNSLLNTLPKGKYHVTCYCFDNEGKDTNIVSRNLEITKAGTAGPKRLCEDCLGGIACKTEDCQKISEELKSFNKKCEYKPDYLLGILIANRCTTAQL